MSNEHRLIAIILLFYNKVAVTTQRDVERNKEKKMFCLLLESYASCHTGHAEHITKCADTKVTYFINSKRSNIFLLLTHEYRERIIFLVLPVNSFTGLVKVVISIFCYYIYYYSIKLLQYYNHRCSQNISWS